MRKDLYRTVSPWKKISQFTFGFLCAALLWTCFPGWTVQGAEVFYHLREEKEKEIELVLECYYII